MDLAGLRGPAHGVAGVDPEGARGEGHALDGVVHPLLADGCRQVRGCPAALASEAGVMISDSRTPHSAATMIRGR